MNFIKNLLTKFFHFICKLNGYDAKAEEAKTAAMEEQAQADIAAARAETEEVLARSVAIMEELAAKEAHAEACHAVVMRCLDLAKRHDYPTHEVMAASKEQDLAALEAIERDMIDGIYEHIVEVPSHKAQKAQKKAKVKHMGRRAAHA